jgi:hypothetical protein
MRRTWSSVACRNDVFDSDTEVDKNKRESVVNMTGRFVSMHPSFFSFLQLLFLFLIRTRLQPNALIAVSGFKY